MRSLRSGKNNVVELMATVVAIHQPPQNSDKVGVQNDLLLHSFLSSQACVHILDFLPWESIHKVMQVVHLAECSASKIAVVSSMEPSWTLPCWAAVKSEKIQTTTAIPLVKTAVTGSWAIEVAPNVRLFCPQWGLIATVIPSRIKKSLVVVALNARVPWMNVMAAICTL